MDDEVVKEDEDGEVTQDDDERVREDEQSLDDEDDESSWRRDLLQVRLVDEEIDDDDDGVRGLTGVKAALRATRTDLLLAPAISLQRQRQ